MPDRYTIGKVNLDSNLILAPMANLMNLPLRLAFRDFGFGLTMIGFISADSTVKGDKKHLINLCGREETTDNRESPVAIQLIGCEPSVMADAARMIEPYADIIDLNFGCPINSVVKKKFGAALLKEPILLNAIVKTVVQSVRIPVTAKIRILSASDPQPTCEIARLCEDAGAAAITVHARTPQEGFFGKAHWEVLRDIKRSVKIPLIGNGSVSDLSDVKTLLNDIGCNYVMVGVGAMRNPVGFFDNKNKAVEPTLWDFGRRYAMHAKKRFFNTPLALFDYFSKVSIVNNFVRRSVLCE